NLFVNYTWDLPFFSGAAGAARLLLRDWQVGGIANVQSGYPLTAFVAANRSRSLWSPSINSATGFDRPSMDGGSNDVVTGSPDGYLDRRAFVQPESVRLGHAERTY